MESQYLKNIEKDIKVEILTEQRKLLRGNIKEILSKSEFNFSGVKVMLTDGTIGRVQKILLDEGQKNKKAGNEIESLIKKGENFYVEFKSSSLWSLNFTDEDIKQSKSFDVHTFKQKASKVIIAKSIASFLNSEGGNLIIGIKEKKQSNENDLEIIGIDEEYKKLKDPTKDGYKRMILDDIIRSFFAPEVYNHLNEYLSINFAEINNKTLCLIRITRSQKRTFLTVNGKKIFMIRTENENRQLEGEDLVDYCLKRYKL
ncbi:MAG: RNA-binding domain-containing protein [Candidatus Pacearchaeota archaeon]|jgi:uncharacterized repeat protein (TIGR03833 family)